MELFELSGEQALATTINTLVIYAGIMIYTRIFGLRSFSKMAGYEFSMTVAFGSILATVMLARSPMLGIGLFTMAVLFTLQKLIAMLRRRSSWFQHIVDNYPMVLMYEGQFLEENMRITQVTREDLIAKLREANVFSLSAVHAVVLETTGDISVLHDDDPSKTLDPILLEGVKWTVSGDRTPNMGITTPDPAANTP